MPQGKRKKRLLEHRYREESPSLRMSRQIGKNQQRAFPWRIVQYLTGRSRRRRK